VVAANQTSPLLNIQSIDQLYVDFTVAETDLPQVRSYLAKGPLSILAVLPDDSKSERVGTLSFLDNTVQSSAGTVQLRAVMSNQDRVFWPGQFVKVRLILETIRGALMVPSQAVQISQQGYYVYVVKDDQTVDMRLIQPGQRQGDMTVITQGLKPGEKVVVTGQITLAPGSKVATSEYKAPDLLSPPVNGS
jgi:multidrug efflux system membrane fusion protein